METRRRVSVITACAAVAVAFLIAAAPAQRQGAAMELAAAAVPDLDSLAAMVMYLSIDAASGEPRSRYVLREEELAAVADTLAARLERYTGNPVLRQSFTIEQSFAGRDSIFYAENLIARISGTGVSSGVVAVSAHFDAIASRSPGWRDDWRHMPAPGANDNATGVAAVLEAARLLAGKILPFDVEFVLFSGEELGRLGSIYYVEQCDDECADDMLGVINLDMIGFRGERSGASCMSDYRSGWLADLLVTHAATAAPEFPVTIIKPSPSNWDHASFWEREAGRITAVTLAEPLGDFGAILYPHYHTVDDVAEHIDMAMMQRIGSIVTGFLASFENRPAEMSLLPSDILLLADGAVRAENVYQEGEEVSALIRVRNTGGAEAPAGGAVRLSVFIENARGKTSLYCELLVPPAPLRSSDVLVPLPTGAAQGGENRLGAFIDVSGMPDSQVDNAAETEFVIVSTERLLRGHFFRPHPIRGAFSAATLCLNLAGDADLMLEVFTLEGQKAGVARLGSGYGVPISTGLSCHRCGDIFETAEKLAAGIYLYRIIVYDVGGGLEEHTGRFAVLN